MPSAIVIGASKGIGEALVREFARGGYTVGLASRNLERLEALKNELANASHVKRIDVAEAEHSRVALDELINEMNGVDVIVLNAGVMYPEPSWDEVAKTIGVNVTGFAALAEKAMEYFTTRGGGHIVGISSVAALRGARRSSVYNASKAFESNYLDGLRHRAARAGLPIHVTDIKPGSVRTQLIEGRKSLFWVATAEKAASQIFDAIRKKKKRAYVTKRWRLVAWAIRAVPDWLYHKA